MLTPDDYLQAKFDLYVKDITILSLQKQVEELQGIVLKMDARIDKFKQDVEMNEKVIQRYRKMIDLLLEKAGYVSLNTSGSSRPDCEGTGIL